MEMSTFDIIWCGLLAATIVFYVYGKAYRLKDIGDRMVELQVHNPHNPDLQAVERQFRFWDRVPSLTMLAMALGTMIVTQL